MADLESLEPQDPADETVTVEAPADEAQGPEETAPVICDPVIGFVCPNEAMKRAAF
ncbi:MAG TPA: hypothetical protein VG407_09380 [Caulobacteraceae bacterium]|jgi:hypothetical protein|nr:hypothetical protein [Caulobacteraceae bacterium]